MDCDQRQGLLPPGLRLRRAPRMGCAVSVRSELREESEQASEANVLAGGEVR